MISFKMKILNYNTEGSYSVEYIPENKKCTPVKLDIRIDTNTSTVPSEVIELLKKSSPQEYWRTEIGVDNVDHNALRSLVNTVHRVTSIEQTSTGYSTPAPSVNRSAIAQRLQRTNRENVTNPGVEGYTPNQRVADFSEQQRIKLKVIIQQVIQEMAEGTI